jgi:hypothetical protein
MPTFFLGGGKNGDIQKKTNEVQSAPFPMLLADNASKRQNHKHHSCVEHS